MGYGTVVRFRCGIGWLRKTIYFYFRSFDLLCYNLSYRSGTLPRAFRISLPFPSRMDEPYAHLFNLKGYKNPINTLSFSASGEFLATGGEDGVVWIWDPQDGKFVASFDVKSPVLCLEWDPDFRKRLFFGCQDGTVAFVDDFGKVTRLLQHCS